jgi:hypothetical protein
MTDNQDNIFFVLDDENNEKDNEIDINELLDHLQNEKIEINDDLIISHMIHYNENFTIKELLIICDYYEITKIIKTKNKDDIIHYLVEFESNPNNNHIVLKRQNLWFYINELKNDKFMKKYVLW